MDAVHDVLVKYLETIYGNFKIQWLVCRSLGNYAANKTVVGHFWLLGETSTGRRALYMEVVRMEDQEGYARGGGDLRRGGGTIHGILRYIFSLPDFYNCSKVSLVSVARASKVLNKAGGETPV